MAVSASAPNKLKVGFRVSRPIIIKKPVINRVRVILSVVSRAALSCSFRPIDLAIKAVAPIPKPWIKLKIIIITGKVKLSAANSFFPNCPT